MLAPGLVLRPNLHKAAAFLLVVVRSLSTYLLPESSKLQDDREVVRNAALGYLKTWFYLIKYEFDFMIAETISAKSLLPESVSWEPFCECPSNFENIHDGNVAMRYSYGEIRLTCLNFYATFLVGKSTFQHVDAQYRSYFTRYYGPLLFVYRSSAVL